jgi:hypothetical protein
MMKNNLTERVVRPIAYAAAILLLSPVYLAAQEARFQTGAFRWTPVLTLRDAGLDTNVYDEAVNPRRDNLAVLSPQVDGVFDNGAWSLALSGKADFVYFQRYTGERSINRGGTARLDVPLSRVRPFAAIGYVDTRDRQNAEIDLRARRVERDVTLGANLQVTSRTAVEALVKGSDARFRDGENFRGVDLATRLNREATGGAVRGLFTLSPLTTFVVETELRRDRFVFSPEYDADNFTVQGGFEFAPDAVIRGRALVGYRKMDALGASAIPFDGLTTTVDLSYVLLGRTRFSSRVDREAQYSIGQQPYFLRTSYGGEVLHNVAGPLDLLGRYSRETLGYPGVPASRLPPSELLVNRYGGAIAVRPATRLAFSVNYEFTERLSETTPDLGFDRRRVYTTITYGF